MASLVPKTPVASYGPMEKALQVMLLKQCNEVADYIFTRSQQLLVEHKNIDRGRLLQSGTIKYGLFQTVIHYDAPYAAFIEYGTAPHPVSSSKLVGWARRKFGVDSKQAQQIAFLVARKIAREGMEAKPFLRPAIAEAKIKYGFRGSIDLDTAATPKAVVSTFSRASRISQGRGVSTERLLNRSSRIVAKGFKRLFRARRRRKT